MLIVMESRYDSLIERLLVMLTTENIHVRHLSDLGD
jgi:hypothetical protein